MAFSTLVSYLAGLGLLRWRDGAGAPRLPDRPDRRSTCCCSASSSTPTSASRTPPRLSDLAGPSDRFRPLHIVLPVGISFYTFHTITYIVDSYRGVITPTRNLFEFSSYVSLFAQLVAGPIVRFRQIEQDLEHIDQAERPRSTSPPRGRSSPSASSKRC